MSAARRVAAAVAAVGAVATGLLVTAPPATADTAFPTYECSGGWYTGDAEFGRDLLGRLVVYVDIPSGFTTSGWPTTAVTTTFGTSGLPGPSATLTPGTYYSIVLVGSYGTLTTAPVVHLKASPFGGPATSIDCYPLSAGFGWPV